MDTEKNTYNQKKGKGVNIFLILIILGLIIFICYDKLYLDKESEVQKEVKETEKDSKKEEILDIYSDEIQKLYNNIHTSNCDEDTIDFYSDGAVNLDNFKANAFYMAYDILLDEKGVVQDNGYKKLASFTYDEINEKAKLIFGKDFNVEDKIYAICPYQYNSSAKTYTYNEQGGCGCTSGPDRPIITLYKAVAKDNEIHLYESVVYSKFKVENNSTDYYKDPLYNQKINNDACNENFSNKGCIDNSTKYEFIFKLEKENYILSNIIKAV